MEKTPNNKRELKIVFSSEIYDELKYVFRKDQLKNIIYRPIIIDEKRWLCSCGYETEAEVCPICGMEKNTVFSKVNANYLLRHKKMRLARHSKADESKKAMMAQMIKPTKKQKQKKNNKKLGTLIGVLCLCVALMVSVVMIFGTGSTENPPIDQTTIGETTPIVTDTSSPETTTGDSSTESTPTGDTTDTPATDTPTTDTPSTDTPVIDDQQPTVIPSEAVTNNVATVPDGKVASGASGNTAMGGLVYSGTEYDYIAKDGITVLDKNGNTNSVLTSNKALSISGNDKYIVYIAEDNLLHVIDLGTKADTVFGIKATAVTVAFDRLYYKPFGENELYSVNFEGKEKQLLTDKEVFAINATADKLYFSTSESLCVLTSKDGPVNTFCADGAGATSIIEITGYVFYTAKDGKLKYYNPARPAGFSVEYPVYIGNVTALVAYENRVYIRVDNSGNISWRVTTWQEGTKLFDVNKFVITDITTPSLFVTNNAVFDGELNRTPIQ